MKENLKELMLSISSPADDEEILSSSSESVEWDDWEERPRVVEVEEDAMSSSLLRTIYGAVRRKLFSR